MNVIKKTMIVYGSISSKIIEKHKLKKNAIEIWYLRSIDMGRLDKHGMRQQTN